MARPTPLLMSGLRTMEACAFSVVKACYVEVKWLNYWKDHKEAQKKRISEVVKTCRGRQHGVYD